MLYSINNNFIESANNIDDASYCNFRNLSLVIDSVLCNVESKNWKFPQSLSDYKALGCLLDNFPTSRKGNNLSRCSSVRPIPRQSDILPSLNPPEAKNKHYQYLATTAEKLVPVTYWRQGYANDQLLLSHNNSELPKRLLDTSQLRNKKLKNILACVTRQVFIRKSFEFDSYNSIPIVSKCKDESVIKAFFDLWIVEKEKLGGSISSVKSKASWTPGNSGNLLMRALDALDYYYLTFGGIWQGCFGIDSDSYCRGGLAGILFIFVVSPSLFCDS